MCWHYSEQNKPKFCLKKLESNGQIIITREPSTTGKGKKATYMSEEKGKKVYVRWAQ